MPLHITTAPVLTEKRGVRTLQILRRTYPELRGHAWKVTEDFRLDEAAVEPVGGATFRVVDTGELLHRLSPRPG
ncbi:MAG: hypothetical protein EOO29_12975 [Comamonadaceae bacterium]|nr:MAG: hypothetical protein EOO29_12975 [Comamonadaceae bacterium]